MDRNGYSLLNDPASLENYALAIELTLYAIESGDRELVDRIIEERRPSSVEHLKALHDEFRGIAPSLQDGTL